MKKQLLTSTMKSIVHSSYLEPYYENDIRKLEVEYIYFSLVVVIIHFYDAVEKL